MNSPSIAYAGYACPHCQSRTDVKDSRPRTEGGIRRRRVCVACGVRFTTWEVQVGDVADILSGVANASPGVVTQAQELVARLGELDADDRLILVSLARRLSGGGRPSKRLYEIAEPEIAA